MYSADMSAATGYLVHCDCGASVPVAQSAAGGQVSCRCGRTIDVPRLSELRRQAGQEAYAISPIDQIRAMLNSKQPPPGCECAYSHVITNDVMTFTIVCERPYATGGYSWWWLFWMAIISLPAFYIARREAGEVQGRELIVRVPLRIAAHCQPEVRRQPGWHLKNLLYTVPLYARLLDEYPNAEVHC
jgi:hypothetical protein